MGSWVGTRPALGLCEEEQVQPDSLPGAHPGPLASDPWLRIWKSLDPERFEQDFGTVSSLLSKRLTAASSPQGPRHHLKTYKSVLPGSKLVDWLLAQVRAPLSGCDPELRG